MGELAPGAAFAEHLIRGLVGRGGMGVVYHAVHVPLNREVALKVIVPHLSADPVFQARFRRESMAAASITHPNVIPIYDAGERDGRLYLKRMVNVERDAKATDQGQPSEVVAETREVEVEDADN